MPELLPAADALADEAGATITAIEPHEPTLERVFLHLTGRELRDCGLTERADRCETASSSP